MTTHKKPDDDKRSHHKKPDEDEDKRSHHKKPAREPVREPQAGDDTSRQDAAADAPAGAEASPAGLPDETELQEIMEARDRAVRAQVQDFVENLPPGAEEGLYSATAHDRWSNGPYQPDIPDGTYAVADAGGWAITFRAGRIISARREDRMTASEKRAVMVITS
jgi:hypothetical protein